MKFCFNGVKYHSIQDALANNPVGYTNQIVSFMSYIQGVSGFNEKGQLTKRTLPTGNILLTAAME